MALFLRVPRTSGIARPQNASNASVVQVKLRRNGKSLGVHLKDGPHFLLVLGVEDGVVKDSF